MKSFRDQVLTIFCLPRECTKSKEIFYENLGTTSFIELKEEWLSGEYAEDFLKLLAEEQGFDADQSLFHQPEADKQYLVPELREVFDGWYDQKLKSSVYTFPISK